MRMKVTVDDKSITKAILVNPYDVDVRKVYGEQQFVAGERDYKPGTIERARFILRLMNDGFPSPKLRAAYLENLTAMLKDRPRRKDPGQIVIGLGSGRCGSTSLT